MKRSERHDLEQSVIAQRDLDTNAAAAQLGKQNVELAKSDKGLTTDDRKMQRLVFLHKCEDVVDQVIAFLARQVSEQRTAEMLGIVGVAAGIRV